MKRDFIFRRPSVLVNLGFHIPNAIPRVVPSTGVGGDTVSHGTRRIYSKPETVLPVVVWIKANGNSIRFNKIVSPDQSGDNFLGFTIIAHDSKIDGFVIVGDLERGALCCRFSFIWVALVKALVEGSTFPYLVVQNAI